MSTSSAAKALRDSFGDRKLPGITRKITACVACRKLKIKCHMNDDKPPCTRCKRRGLSCSVNRSLQAILESDASWKEEVERRLSEIEQSINHSTALSVDAETGPSRSHATTLPSATPDIAPANGIDRVSLNLHGSLGAFPASSLTDLSSTKDTGDSDYLPDIISRGTISLAAAREHYDFYKTHLDPLIHHVLEDTTTIADVRIRSSLLTSAICAVAAFCTGSQDCKTCVNAFTGEVTRRLFSVKYEFDDVRALCIGAFWLSDISSALNGMAVRIGTQLDLHRCITKMPHTKKDCYDRTRLYFLLYLCDHHCSLIYGRPPMTTEFRSLKGPGAFLQSEFSTKTDLNLISQVEFWSLNRRVFDLFGSDIESSIVGQRFAELQRLSDAMDGWYADWIDVLALPVDANSIPRRMFDFYFYSAKLYLFSHLFRGPSEAELPAHRQGAQDLTWHASNSALSILRSSIAGDEIHPFLEKLPSYFGTMIAFASVCLIRTKLRSPSHGDMMTNETIHLLRRVPEVVRDSPLSPFSSHPLVSIAKSLEAAINEEISASTPRSGEYATDLSFDFDLFASDPTNLMFPGDEEFWNLCPEQMPQLIL